MIVVRNCFDTTLPEFQIHSFFIQKTFVIYSRFKMKRPAYCCVLLCVVACLIKLTSLVQLTSAINPIELFEKLTAKAMSAQQIEEEGDRAIKAVKLKMSQESIDQLFSVRRFVELELEQAEQRNKLYREVSSEQLIRGIARHMRSNLSGQVIIGGRLGYSVRTAWIEFGLIYRTPCKTFDKASRKWWQKMRIRERTLFNELHLSWLELETVCKRIADTDDRFVELVNDELIEQLNSERRELEADASRFSLQIPALLSEKLSRQNIDSIRKFKFYVTLKCSKRSFLHKEVAKESLLEGLAVFIKCHGPDKQANTPISGEEFEKKFESLVEQCKVVDQLLADWWTKESGQLIMIADDFYWLSVENVCKEIVALKTTSNEQDSIGEALNWANSFLVQEGGNRLEEICIE